MLQPTEIVLVNDQSLTIRWNDGHAAVYFADNLRFNCPCAICEKARKSDPESTEHKELAKTSSSVRINEFKMIGRYAIGIEFSDGHNLGMYAYDYLYQLCQCDACRSDVTRIQGPVR
ncbi:gamma-butyrobetaine hydroxylase family protein [Calditrichota bacterium LG25]